MKFTAGDRVYKRKGRESYPGTIIELKYAGVYSVVFDHLWLGLPTLCTEESLTAVVQHNSETILMTFRTFKDAAGSNQSFKMGDRVKYLVTDIYTKELSIHGGTVIGTSDHGWVSVLSGNTGKSVTVEAQKVTKY